MCTYCYCGDHFSKWDPPYKDWDQKNPLIPKPLVPSPITPWPIDKAKEYLDLLKQIKELEDKLGCPCEPNKADYITLLQEYVDKLKKNDNKNKKNV